jgi:DivIVA domain-containing protein
VDRDEIQRQDFPTGRRGYDPAAVDAHLRRVADELEGLRRPAPPPSLSGGTSEQVRLILEAAERSADELRARAGDEASAHVTRVREAADGLLGRLDELEAELGRLLQGLRQSGERLAGDEPPPLAAPDLPSDDEAGARLIALNMALDGTPRAETARYLAQHFALADPDALLDDVYSRAER